MEEVSHSLLSFRSSPPRMHNCLLFQTDAPPAVLCTCYLVYQPSAVVSRQVHLSASAALQRAVPHFNRAPSIGGLIETHRPGTTGTFIHVTKQI